MAGREPVDRRGRPRPAPARGGRVDPDGWFLTSLLAVSVLDANGFLAKGAAWLPPGRRP